MSKHSIFDETEVPNPFEEDIDDVGESRVLTEKDLLLKEIFECDINVAERIVFLESAIRKSAAGYILKRVGIIKKFSGDDESPVTLHVSSYGGDAYGMLAAIDAINMSTIPINTIGVGPIMSAASGILAAGTGTRQMTENSWMMLHEIQSWFEGSARDLMAEAKHIKQLQDSFCRIYEACSNKPRSYWKQRLGQNFYLSAEECLELELIDKIT